MWLQRSSRCAAVAAVVASSGVVAVGLAGPASATVIAEQNIGAQCQPATSQECPQMPEVHFTVPGGANVRAYFTANSDHCSDINVRLIKDDPTTGWYPASQWLRAGPGQTVQSPGIDLGPGDHVIKVAAQGIEGGCNVGHLDAWGGTLRVEAVAIPTTAPRPTPTRFQIPPFGPAWPDDLGLR